MLDINNLDQKIVETKKLLRSLSSDFNKNLFKKKLSILQMKKNLIIKLFLK